MAVVVDISDSKHFSYSPLNEKHNILYDNTRRCINQRYKQKPWFRLNPFTDRGVGRGENLDRYDPDFDTSLSQLQSLVIVEDYFNDTPQFTKEFNISEFWDFLFSDSWSSGYAVRVFEGQLLELMVTSLISLTRTGKVVQHVTKAFAKNKRQKYSVVKTSKKVETELVPFIETLFLRFIYYGHAVKPACFDPESSMGYPDAITTTTTSSCIREPTDTYSSENDGLQTVANKPSALVPMMHSCQNPRATRARASIDSKSQIEKERTLITRFLSHNNESIIPTPPPIPRGKSYRYTCSNFSNASDDYKVLPPRDDLKNFICTEKVSYSEKVSYLGEFSLPDDSSSTSSSSAEEDQVDEDFGQQFYLGAKNEQHTEDAFETTERKLQKRKEILKQKRETRKEELVNLKSAKTNIMPAFSELEIDKYVKDLELKKVFGIKESDRVPTFEEYADMLEADQKREAKLRARNIARKRTEMEIFAGKLSQGTASPSDTTWKMGLPAQRKLLLEKFQKAKAKKKVVKRTNKIEIPLVYVSTATGITYLHPVSRQLLLIKRMEEQKKRSKEFRPDVSRRRTSLLPTSPTALVHELHKLRQAYITSAKDGKDKKQVGPKFPKIKLIPSGIESPDDSDVSDDEQEDELDESLFDAKKLNIRYSRDRIRKAKALKKQEELEYQQKTRKPHFTQVLKKYIRMQSIFTAFTKPSKKQRRSSLAGALSSTSKKKKKTSEKALELYKESEKDESCQFDDVGKLKWFSFLEAKDRAKLQSTEPLSALFESYPIELFRENLERALKEFVVRRETVVSDHNGKSLVSITFTKKSVFTTSKYANK